MIPEVARRLVMGYVGHDAGPSRTRPAPASGRRARGKDGLQSFFVEEAEVGPKGTAEPTPPDAVKAGDFFAARTEVRRK